MTKITSKENVKSEIKSLLIVIIIALMIRTFVLELFFVPTGSMKATILEGDYIFSTKYSYGFSRYSIPFSPNIFSGRIFEVAPERGDVIIMRPPHDMSTRFIKRLIGLPFDKIEIKEDITYINDIPIERTEIGEYSDENSKKYIKYKEVLPNGRSFYSYKLKYAEDSMENSLKNFGPYTIPAGHFFFIGDNRDESGDSRFQLGFVPSENLIAKAQFIFFSTKEFFWDEKAGVIEQISRIWPWISSVRLNRLFTSLYDN